MIKSKVCSKCKIEKLASEYTPRYDRPSGIRPCCKACQRVIDARRRRSESGVKKHRKKAWKLQGIDITYDEYAAKYEKVGGCCEICSIKLDTLCVDHNHETGTIRGLLCTPCNLGIDHFKESEQIMINAINYLQTYKELI